MSSLGELQRRNVELVRQGVEAFQRGDLDGLLALTREDFEVFLPPDLPNSGTYVGHDGFRAWLAQWLEAWEDFTVEIVEATPAGARHVVADIRQSGRGMGSGIPVEMEVAYLWDIRGDRIAAMHLYASREAAVEAAERREREASE